MPYQDLISTLERNYNPEYSDKLSDSDIISIFWDPRFIHNQQVKYDIVKWLIIRNTEKYDKYTLIFERLF